MWLLRPCLAGSRSYITHLIYIIMYVKNMKTWCPLETKLSLPLYIPVPTSSNLTTVVIFFINTHLFIGGF